MLDNNVAKAFLAASGIAESNLSLSIRTVLLVGFFIWATWCALELMKFHKEHYKENISRLLSQYIKLFFLITIIVTLVFIP